MDEFVYRGSPIEPIVPVVRNWLSPALRSWAQIMYGGRRRFWIAGGWFLLVVLAWLLLKFVIYANGVLVLFAAFVLSAAFDLASYPLRRR